MLIPFQMLWKVQIGIRQKIILASIFSLTIFIIVVAIVRISFILQNLGQSDATWLHVWTSIEQTMCA